MEQKRFAKRNKYRAADRMRTRIGNLIGELHHQDARWLVDHFDIILLSAFETSEVVLRGARKLRAKSVRSMLSYAHYRFQQFLRWKCWQTGKQLLLVNEAYTSKTCSWSGEIIASLGGRKAIAGSEGIRMNRGTNGARGIFLRALGGTPALCDVFSPPETAPSTDVSRPLESNRITSPSVSKPKENGRA